MTDTITLDSDPSKYMIIFTTRADREDTTSWNEEHKTDYNNSLLFNSTHCSDFTIDDTFQEFRGQVEEGRHPHFKIESEIGRKLNGENVFSYLHLWERPCTKKGERFGQPYEDLLADYLSKLYNNSLQQASPKDISNVIFMLHGSTDFLDTPSRFTNESISNSRSFDYITKKANIPNLQIYTFQHSMAHLAFNILRGEFWNTSHNEDFPATRHIIRELEKFNLQTK
jgi:hypothetical protein